MFPNLFSVPVTYIYIYIYIIYIYIYIYIYRRGMDFQSIEHRGLAYCYTAYIYRREKDPPVNGAQWPCILLHCIYI